MEQMGIIYAAALSAVGTSVALGPLFGPGTATWRGWYLQCLLIPGAFGLIILNF